MSTRREGDAGGEGPVDVYLDDLFVELRKSAPRDARSMLSEAEAHLRDTAGELEAAGMSQLEAETEALRRFGDARMVAASDRARDRSVVVRGILLSAWSLAAWGAVAVGLSGLLAGIMRFAGGSSEFLAGPWSRSGIQASDCARWLSSYPRAGSCARAAMDDWAFETVAYRVALGLLGVVALAALWTARRRLLRGPHWAPLPSTVVDTVGTTIFGATGVWLAALGVDALAVSSGHGSGQWLSAAPVALAAAAVFGLRLLTDLRAAN